MIPKPHADSIITTETPRPFSAVGEFNAWLEEHRAEVAPVTVIPVDLHLELMRHEGGYVSGSGGETNDLMSFSDKRITVLSFSIPVEKGRKVVIRKIMSR